MQAVGGPKPTYGHSKLNDILSAQFATQCVTNWKNYGMSNWHEQLFLSLAPYRLQ